MRRDEPTSEWSIAGRSSDSQRHAGSRPGDVLFDAVPAQAGGMRILDVSRFPPRALSSGEAATCSMIEDCISRSCDCDMTVPFDVDLRSTPKHKAREIWDPKFHNRMTAEDFDEFLHSYASEAGKAAAAKATQDAITACLRSGHAKCHVGPRNCSRKSTSIEPTVTFFAVTIPSAAGSMRVDVNVREEGICVRQGGR